MDKYQIQFSLSGALSQLKPLNSSFDVGVLRVAYTGNNPNRTSFSRESFERAADSIFNCPIVANYDVETDEIGGHDEELVDTLSGSQYVNVTEPVGVIPESAKYFWEQVDDNGTLRDYFCVDGVILWKRQACYHKLVANGITSQSMEISVKSGNLVDGILNIDDFQFEAFCLLERDEPCFSQASLQLFSKSDFKNQWRDMLREYADICKEEKIGGVNVGEQEIVQVETVEAVEVIADATEVVANETVEAVVENVVEATEEVQEIEEVADTVVAEVSAAEAVEVESEVQEQEVVDSAPESFSLTASQIADELYNAVSANADHAQMYVQDWDEANVYLYDSETGHLYGCPYQIVDSAVQIDFQCKKRKKMSYVDFDAEVEDTTAFATMISSIVANTAASLQQVIDGLNAQVTELQAYKQQKIADERNVAETALFDSFDAKLSGNAEYATLKENAANYSLDELENRCFAIIGKMNFSKQTMPVKRIPVEREVEDTVDAYGGLLKFKKTNYGG